MQSTRLKRKKKKKKKSVRCDAYVRQTESEREQTGMHKDEERARSLVVTMRVLLLLRVRHASMRVGVDAVRVGTGIRVRPARSTGRGLHSVLVRAVHVVILVIPCCWVDAVSMVHAWLVVVDAVSSRRCGSKRGSGTGKAISALFTHTVGAVAVVISTFVVRVVITHAESSTSGSTRRERLHHVGIRIVFELGPLDVSIAIVKVAESARAKLEVEEDESSEHQDTASDRDADDETCAGTAGCAVGARLFGGRGDGCD